MRAVLSDLGNIDSRNDMLTISVCGASRDALIVAKSCEFYNYGRPVKGKRQRPNTFG